MSLNEGNFCPISLSQIFMSTWVFILLSCHHIVIWSYHTFIVIFWKTQFIIKSSVTAYQWLVPYHHTSLSSISDPHCQRAVFVPGLKWRSRQPRGIANKWTLLVSTTLIRVQMTMTEMMTAQMMMMAMVKITKKTGRPRPWKSLQYITPGHRLAWPPAPCLLWWLQWRRCWKHNDDDDENDEEETTTKLVQ